MAFLCNQLVNMWKAVAMSPKISGYQQYSFNYVSKNFIRINNLNLFHNLLKCAKDIILQRMIPEKYKYATSLTKNVTKLLPRNNKQRNVAL